MDAQIVDEQKDFCAASLTRRFIILMRDNPAGGITQIFQAALPELDR